jgi:hypothetical protein
MGGKSRWDYLKAIYSRYKEVSKPLRARTSGRRQVAAVAPDNFKDDALSKLLMFQDTERIRFSYFSTTIGTRVSIIYRE